MAFQDNPEIYFLVANNKVAISDLEANKMLAERLSQDCKK
jgi:hypothetical protein